MLKDRAFIAQCIATFPTIRAIRKLGALNPGQLADVEAVSKRPQPTKTKMKLNKRQKFSPATLNSFARRIAVRASRDKLTLSAPQLDVLRKIVAQGGKRRGTFYSVLFTGPPGTDKTRTAQVLARELHQGLYRVDLSLVVSKYIGETEKNLRRLFADADVANVILFFDEADALFGKRTEVKDAHDRYANVEIGYLLQQLESHRGLVIIATNRKGNLDDAFTRRLRFVVDFAAPEPAVKAGKSRRER